MSQISKNVKQQCSCALHIYMMLMPYIYALLVIMLVLYTMRLQLDYNRKSQDYYRKSTDFEEHQLDYSRKWIIIENGLSFVNHCICNFNYVVICTFDNVTCSRTSHFDNVTCSRTYQEYIHVSACMFMSHRQTECN